MSKRADGENVLKRMNACYGSGYLQIARERNKFFSVWNFF